METIGSKRSYALIWCMPNNDDDDGGLLDMFCAKLVTESSQAGQCSA